MKIKDLCFARNIRGGYEITSVTDESYFVRTLPEKCLYTDKPVIYNPVVVARIEKLTNRSRELCDFVFLDLSNAIENLGMTTPDQMENFAQAAALVQLRTRIQNFLDELDDSLEQIEEDTDLAVEQVLEADLREAGQSELIDFEDE